MMVHLCRLLNKAAMRKSSKLKKHGSGIVVFVLLLVECFTSVAMSCLVAWQRVITMFFA